MSGCRGRALTVALTAAVLTAVCAVGGFYIGRDVLGEQYLKRGAATLRAQPTPYVASPSRTVEEPVIDEPPSAEPEPTAPPRKPRADQQRPGGHGAATTAAPSPPTVTLQLGCFLDSRNAKELLQDLRNRGYAATVTVDKQDQTTLHRVTMGGLSPERAQALAANLRREGYGVMVIGGSR